MGESSRKTTKHSRDRIENQDPCRPQYHFLPPANWMNDPCGLIQWKGQYHLFYQYNPNGASHSTIHWGHAVSADLVQWRDLPIALAPTPGEADEQGCWTGCAVNNDGVPTLLYTGVFPQVVCLAASSDDLLTWQKFAGNPVIKAPPDDVRHGTGGHFRDPFVWQEDGLWYMVIGAKLERVGGVVLLYRSQDLIHWEYLHPLLAGDLGRAEPFWTGTMWECPNLLDLGDKRALLISIQATPADHLYAVYHTGVYEAQRFTSETQGILVHGECFYAPQAMRLDDGRCVLWGWLKEGRSQRVAERAGWAGVMSLPLAVSLQPGGELALEPVPELQVLRGRHWHFEDLELDSAYLLDGVQGDSLEILVECEPDGAAEFGLRLRCAPDEQEQTRLIYRSAERQVVVERGASSTSQDVERDERAAPVAPAAGEPLRLHIFLDRSVLEVFVNGGRTCLACRIYPTRPDSLGVGLFARGGKVKLKSMDIYRMRTIGGRSIRRRCHR